MKTTIVIFIAFVLSGCAPQYASWHPIGGSKADGVVLLSYNTGGFIQAPQDSGLSIAVSRCINWGYSSAEAFSGVDRQCNYYYNGICMGFKISKQFQCID